MCNFFIKEGAQVHIYDPKVAKEQIYLDLVENGICKTNEEADKSVKIFTSAYDAVKESDAVVIVTEWDEFKELNYKKIYDSMRKPAFLFDGRLILDGPAMKNIGFQVEVIGKKI